MATNNAADYKPTNHSIIVGTANGNITNVGPSSTAGQVLQSGGASADPAYSTATYPTTAGTVGNVLKSDGTNIVSSAFSGNLVLIDTKTATNSATVNFTTGISGYDQYVLKWTNVLLATNNQQLGVQYSTDGGSNYSATGYANIQLFSTGAGAGGANVGTTFATIMLGQSNGTATLPGSGQATFYDWNNSSNQKSFNSVTVTLNASGFIPEQNTGYWTTTTAVNAFQLLSSSGNITKGTFKLYGVVN